MSSGGGSSGGSSTQQVTPYAPAEPALQQILSEAGQLYGQGVGAAGYVHQLNKLYKVLQDKKY
jgi:hypothetical protein